MAKSTVKMAVTEKIGVTIRINKRIPSLTWGERVLFYVYI